MLSPSSLGRREIGVAIAIGIEIEETFFTMKNMKSIEEED